MSTAVLDTFVAVPLSVDLYAELTRRHPGAVSTVLENLAWDFLDRTAESVGASPRSSGGVHWDNLLLPEGTEIRTKYFGDVKVAAIRDGEIVWEEAKHSSMSQLARAMRGGTSNNAWKVLELKRPADGNWQLADFMRR